VHLVGLSIEHIHKVEGVIVVVYVMKACVGNRTTVTLVLNFDRR
jgi:hypothetical protein